MKRKKWLWPVIPVIVLLFLVLLFFGWQYSYTAAFRLGWHMPLRDVTNVSLQFDKKTIEVTDRHNIALLRNAVMKGSMLEYVAAGSSDLYTVTFHLASGKPIVIWLDIYGDVEFYCPTIDKCFEDNGGVNSLAAKISGIELPE